MVTKNKFNPTEQKILRLLYQTKVPLTIGEIAKIIGVSYPTARKYLLQLEKKGVIKQE